MLTEYIFQEGLFVRQKDHNFLRTSFLLVGQIKIFQEGVFVRRTDTIFFQEGMSVHRTDIPFFQDQFFWLPNGYKFFMSTTFLATEQMQISIFQEAFFKYHRTDRQFPRRYLSPNRYFRNRPHWLVSLLDTFYSEKLSREKLLRILRI